MIYDNYQNKIKRLSVYLSKIVKLLPLIIAVFAAIVVISVTLTATKGLMMGKFTCESEAVYGNMPDPKAKAFISKISYEYRSADGGEWTEEMPRVPGEYKIRAVSKTAFGKNRYSEEKSFTLLPKKINVSIANKEIVYGDRVTYSARLAFNDRIDCQSFIAEELPREELTYDSKSVPLRITPNASEIKIFDSNGNDVTGSYVIETSSADVSVLKRPITITVDDAEHVYDGKKFNYDVYELKEGSLKDGDSIVAVFNTYMTNVGSTQNTPKLTLINREGADVTRYYDITENFGSITVTKRLLIINTESATVEYNGDFQKFDSREIDASTPLPKGHGLKILSESNSFKDVGEYENLLSVRVIHQYGYDVTDNYVIMINPGTVKITPKKITLYTGSETFEYDGDPHSCPGIKRSEPKLPSGQYFGTVTSPDITNVGKITNNVKVSIIEGWSSQDVTSNYDIEYVYGTLEVTPRNITVTTKSKTFLYDGKIHQCEEFTIDRPIERHIARLKTNAPGVRFVKDGKVENAFEVIIGVDVYYVSEDKTRFKDLTSNYNIKYVYGNISVKVRPVTIKTASETWIYDGEMHSSPNYFIESYNGLAEGERISADWIALTDVGKSENIPQNFDIVGWTDDSESGEKYILTDNYDITWIYGIINVKYRPVTLRILDEQKVYDGMPLYPNTVVVDESSEYDIVKGHRLDCSPSGSQTNAGESESGISLIKITNRYNKSVLNNYAIKYIKGKLTVKEREITVVIGSAEKYYDRTPLTHSSYELSQDSPYQLVDGHKLYVDVVGSLTEIGECENIINEENTVISDTEKNNVTKNYLINYVKGTLKVKPYAIIYVTSVSDMKIYDGTPLKNPNYELLITDSEKMSEIGHVLTVDVFGSITDPGTTENSMTVSVIDDKGTDVSEFYVVMATEGTLEVKPVPKPDEDEGEGDESEGSAVAKIKTGKNGYIYLRMNSYGSYNGKGFNFAPTYAKLLPGGYSYNYLTTFALMKSGASFDTAELKDSSLYMLPYYAGLEGSYEIPRSDTDYIANIAEYSLIYYQITAQNGGYDHLKGNLGELEALKKNTGASFIPRIFLLMRKPKII